MALPATDNWAGTDGALVSSRTNWAQTVNGGGAALTINTNRVVEHSASGSDIICGWTGDTFGNDQYAKLRMVRVAAGAHCTPGPAVRTSAAASGSGYIMQVNIDDPKWYRAKYVGGTHTGFTDGTATWASNDFAQIEVSGTTITYRQNTTQLTTQTDSALTSGAAGVSGWSDSATIDTAGDDWEGGNMGGGGGGGTQWGHQLAHTWNRIVQVAA